MNKSALAVVVGTALAGGSACAAEAFCNRAASGEYAFEVSSRLEATRDPSSLRAVYEAEFTPKFKSMYGFEDFHRQLTGVQRRLAVGTETSRDLQSRVLTKPEVTGTYSRELQMQQALPGGYSRLEARPGDQLEVEFFTSSQVGKLRQKLQLECTPRGWKTNGIWYLPSSFK